MAAAPKKLLIKTFGCQMNAYDSERMAEALGTAGYAPTDDVAEADLVILNTCHIREKAAEKVYSELGRVRAVKELRARSGLDTKIAVAGCVAQAEGASIIERAGVVDLVVGPQSYHRLPDLIAEAEGAKGGIVATDFPAEDKFAHLPQRPVSRRRPSAFLTVQEGCDKFCTFCVVPYTRGAEFSRPVDGDPRRGEEARRGGRARDHAAWPERERLSWSGARRFCLVARQAAQAPRRDAPRSSGSATPRATRAIWTTISSRLHGDEPKLMPYLHLPFQSGSDRILAAMNRKHSAEDYARLIGRIRGARPDIALSTDIIVGFPGETDDDFEVTMQLVRAIGFAQAFTFKYSARPGTPAADLPGQVAGAVADGRLQRLQSLIEGGARAFDARTVGRTLPVLFERKGRKPGQIAGRSPYQQPVHVEAPERLIGQIVEVDIVAAGPKSLTGVIKSGFEWREPLQAAV